MALAYNPPILPPIAEGLRRAKDRFLDEQLAPRDLVSDVVARSWERSRARGLRPRDKHLFQAAAGISETRLIVERSRHLIEAVTPELEHITATLARANLIALCTDALGVLVHSVHHGSLIAPELRELLRVGRDVGEAELGTTAPGCVIQERTALTIIGEEHFLSEVSCLACAAAPVFAFDGELAGVLDLTGLDSSVDDLAFDLVRIAARAAEQRLFVAEAPGLLVRVHHDPRFLATPLGGMLAIDDDGCVRGACTGLRQTFGLSPSDPARLLESIVDTDRASLERRLFEHDVVEMRANNGARLFASLERRTPQPPAPTAPTLEKLTHELVCRTLAAHHGNVSSAARALGISRGTLYKKARRRA